MGSKLLDKWLTEQGYKGDGLDGRIESYKKAKIAKNKSDTASEVDGEQLAIPEEKSVDKNELDRYNKRGWAEILLFEEDRMLLGLKITEAFIGGQHKRLKDGTKVIDVNNKKVFVGGTYKNPTIELLFAFNSENSNEDEINRFIVLGEKQYEKYTKQDIESWVKVRGELYSQELFVAYNRKNYTSNSVEDIKTRRRATLPESFKSFGYSGRFTIRDGVYVKDESGVSDGAQRPNSVTEEQYSIPEKSSDGQKLTDEQRRYFRNSKVRDEKGRLLAVYHGTKRAGFTTFTKTDDIGYFFAGSISTSRTYANKSKAIYAPRTVNSHIGELRNIK